jgi:hypothetical protein
MEVGKANVKDEVRREKETGRFGHPAIRGFFVSLYN